MKPVFILGSLICLITASVVHAARPAEVFLFKDLLQLSVSQRIVNGNEAARNQFPYQISIQWDRGIVQLGWKHLCGGTIVSTTHVITAAHCFLGYGNYRIIAGILNQNEETPYKQIREVIDIVTHPSYPGGNVVHSGDIAIFKLSSPLVWTEAVQPAILSSKNHKLTGHAIVSGWGYLNSHKPIVSRTLQWANLTVIDFSSCANILVGLMGTSKPLEETMICTVDANKITTCNGDSGGPLVQNGILYGVVSWGFNPCGQKLVPSVYTDVVSFLPWIRSNIPDLRKTNEITSNLLKEMKYFERNKLDNIFFVNI